DINTRNYPITTLAPSFPSTPLSLGFGLCALPFLPLRNPNIPPLLSCFVPSTQFASVGSVASCRASSDQPPLPSSVTCTPPPGLVIRRPGPGIKAGGTGGGLRPMDGVCCL